MTLVTMWDIFDPQCSVGIASRSPRLPERPIRSGWPGGKREGAFTLTTSSPHHPPLGCCQAGGTTHHPGESELLCQALGALSLVMASLVLAVSTTTLLWDTGGLFLLSKGHGFGNQHPPQGPNNSALHLHFVSLALICVSWSLTQAPTSPSALVIRISFFHLSLCARECLSSFILVPPNCPLPFPRPHTALSAFLHPPPVIHLSFYRVLAL